MKHQMDREPWINVYGESQVACSCGWESGGWSTVSRALRELTSHQNEMEPSLLELRKKAWDLRHQEAG